MSLSQKQLTRLLGIIPGLSTVSYLLWPVLFSFISPVLVALYVLAFDVYWLYKAVLMGIYLVSAYIKVKAQSRIDWLKRVGKMTGFDELYQAVILTTYQEELLTLRPSVQSIVESKYPNERIILVLATEKRDSARARQVALALKKEFGRFFFEFLVTEHPDVPGEVKAKGANARFAGKKLTQLMSEKKIAPENVLVTTADADTRFHPQYLSCLAWHYLSLKDPLHFSFQPIPIYANNIWQAPAFSRVLAFGSTFWQMIEATRPWRLINFSTHSMSLATLIKIDFWDQFVVNEDSRQYWRAFFALGGNHQVVPLFVPVYMDAVLAEGYWKTLKGLYKQRRRWAYGVEHFPYVVLESFKHKEIPLVARLVRIYRLFEGNFSWATASLTIAFFGWLPFILNPDFRTTVVSVNMPVLVRNLLIMAWVGLIISAITSTLLLPKRPSGYPKIKFLEMLLQWVLLPLSAIFFGSIPAIDAQMRLLFGKFLGFHVTPKKAIES